MPTSAAPSASFYWHDYETFGTDPRRDRPAQFAGLRTTLDLEPLGSPSLLYCQPAPDVLPNPLACLVTGITPQKAAAEGHTEAEFATRIHAELAAPGTCGVGFNSIRFDDEFTRHLLYRNFYDPYEREWKDGNSRWDIIDLVRLCHALRPAGIEWPRHADGTPSFRLQDLAAANQLAHSRAHDALADVEATVALARLLKRRQPRLWDYYFGLRQKARVRELLDWSQRTAVLHVSSRYPAQRGCLAMVVPLAPHPRQPNQVIVYDLSVDPTPLLELDAEDIADRVFTARADLPEDVARVPLKTVSINRVPALAPLSVLQDTDVRRIGLDLDRCQRHLERLQRAADVAEKVRRVFAMAAPDAAPADPELALYHGFATDADRRVCARVRRAAPAELAQQQFTFRDPRYTELLFRYRARNWPETLSAAERERWQEFRRARLTEPTALTPRTLAEYFAEIDELRRTKPLDGAAQVLLDQLEDWGRRLASEVAS
jgi:exodeoxyribonuclease-1